MAASVGMTGRLGCAGTVLAATLVSLAGAGFGGFDAVLLAVFADVVCVVELRVAAVLLGLVCAGFDVGLGDFACVPDSGVCGMDASAAFADPALALLAVVAPDGAGDALAAGVPERDVFGADALAVFVAAEGGVLVAVAVCVPDGVAA